MAFESQILQQVPTVCLVWKGFIDENAELPHLEVALGSIVEIDLQHVRLINSLGCRKWVNWISKMKGVSVHLLRCSPPIVHQAGILNGFLPAGTLIQSLQVPYACENCGKEFFFVFSASSDLPQQAREPRSCPDCAEALSLDVLPERYFSFLRTQKA